MDIRREQHQEHTESKPKREIVRAFMVQSAFHRDMASHVRKRIAAGESAVAAIADTSFMQVILMEKGQESTKNPGQLLPIGGNIESSESPRKAIAREMQEETQLRPYALKEIGDMTYTHTPKKGTSQDVHTQYFVADIAPSDHAFALHPEEDKSHSFPHLTYQELVALWSEGQVLHDGTRKPMLDSLWPTIIRDKQSDPIPTAITPEAEGRMWQMMREVAAHMEAREFQKKTRVIEHMRALLPIKMQEREHVLTQINKKHSLEDYTEALDAWYVETLQLLAPYARSEAELVDTFVAAVEMTNFEEEMAHAGTSEPEAALRFMMTLLDLDMERDTYLELAAQNHFLAPLAKRLAEFGTTIQEAAGEKDPSRLSHQSVIDSFSGIDVLEKEVGGEHTERFVRDIFRDIFVSPELRDQFTDIGERLTRIHTFIDDMHQEMQHFGTEEFSTSELGLYDEIRHADMTTLLQYAVPTPRAHRYFAEESFRSDKQRAIVFEARRALVLLMLFASYDAAYDAVIERKNQPIQRIITGSFSSIERTTSVVTWKSDETLPNGMPVFRKKEVAADYEVHPGEKVETKELRSFTDANGQTYSVVTYDRTKSRSSYYRKILVRGNIEPDVLTSDVNARSIIFTAGTPDQPYVSERIKRTLTTYPVSDTTGQVSAAEATGVYEDESAVFAILDQLSKTAAEQGKDIRIIDFKPTPRPGQALASSGAGGGAAIRLAKFYIEYIAPTGVRTREEIQVFTPTLNPETGAVEIDAFAYEQQKKDDDHSYAVQRLLQTQGLRSAVELLWPHRVYGDVFRRVHSKKQKKQAIRSRKNT